MKEEARGAAVPDPNQPKKKTGKRGREAHKPTTKSRRRVRMLAGLGFTQEEIGLLIDIGERQLRAHYAHELRVGGLEADEKVLGNLFRLAVQTKDLGVASRNSIFWAKVRRRWHEVQRVIHGYDPETIKTFVRSVVTMLRRELPKQCPGCKTELGLGPKIATQLVQLSQEMATKLPQSEIVMMPRPEQASDGLED